MEQVERFKKSINMGGERVMSRGWVLGTVRVKGGAEGKRGEGGGG